MGLNEIPLAAFLFTLVAILYSSVGHGGASGYLAMMALLSFPPAEIKTTSLILNIAVASIASFQFIRAGYFNLKIFITVAVASIPFSYLGGGIKVNPQIFKLFAGFFLIISSFLLLRTNSFKTPTLKKFRSIILLPSGALIGLFSGFIGVGGGIFLTPFMILLNLTDSKTAGGISALFIVVNSISGLLGMIQQGVNIPQDMPLYLSGVTLGGVIGSWIGVKKFNKKMIRFCLSLVLLSAGIKFILLDFLLPYMR